MITLGELIRKQVVKKCYENSKYFEEQGNLEYSEGFKELARRLENN